MSSEVKPPAASEFESLFKRAIDLRNNDQHSEAAEILRLLREMRPASASVHGILGQILWDDGFLDEAVSSFEKAVQLAPQSELASLGLFHTLWDTGQSQRAINEMLRFLSISDSKEYRGIARSLGCAKLKDEEHFEG